MGSAFLFVNNKQGLRGRGSDEPLWDIWFWLQASTGLLAQKVAFPSKESQTSFPCRCLRQWQESVSVPQLVRFAFPREVSGCADSQVRQWQPSSPLTTGLTLLQFWMDSSNHCVFFFTSTTSRRQESGWEQGLGFHRASEKSRASVFCGNTDLNSYFVRDLSFLLDVSQQKCCLLPRQEWWKALIQPSNLFCWACMLPWGCCMLYLAILAPRWACWLPHRSGPPHGSTKWVLPWLLSACLPRFTLVRKPRPTHTQGIAKSSPATVVLSGQGSIKSHELLLPQV